MSAEVMIVEGLVTFAYATSHLEIDAASVKEVPCGLSVTEMLDEYFDVDHEGLAPLHVYLGGHTEIELEDWDVYYPAADCMILAVHIPQGPLLLPLLASAFAAGGAGTAGGALIAGTTIGVSSTAGILAAITTTVLTVALSILPAALMGSPDQGGANYVPPGASPSLNGVSNDIRLGQPIIKNLGRNLVVFPLATLSYTETVGEEQFQVVVFSGGEGVNTIEEATMKFGETLVSNTETEYVLHYGNGNTKHVYPNASGRSPVSVGGAYPADGPPVLEIATQDIYEDRVDVKFRTEYTGAWTVIQEVIHTTTQAGRFISFELHFPQGFGRLDSGDGELHADTIFLGIEIQEQGGGAWTPIPDLPDFTDGGFLSTHDLNHLNLTGNFGIATEIVLDYLLPGVNGRHVAPILPGTSPYNGNVSESLRNARVENYRGQFKYVDLTYAKGIRFRSWITRFGGSFIDDKVYSGSFFELTGSWPGVPAGTYVEIGIVEANRIEIVAVVDVNRKVRYAIAGEANGYTPLHAPYVFDNLVAASPRTLTTEDFDNVIRITGKSHTEIRQGFKFEAPAGRDNYSIRLRNYGNPYWTTDRYTKDRKGFKGDGIVNTAANYVDFVWTVLRAHDLVTPINEPGQTLIEMRTQSTDHINGVIARFNAVMQSKLRVIAGGVLQATPIATSNAAWCALDTLIGKSGKDPVSDADLPTTIDLDAWEDWADFCDTENLEYNRIHDYDSTQERELYSIAAVGRASFDRTDLITPIIEKAQDPLVYGQAWTPHNCKDMTYERVFTETPHLVRAKFRNAAKNWQPDVIPIYSPEYGPYEVAELDITINAASSTTIVISGATGWEDIGVRVGSWVRFPLGSLQPWNFGNAFLTYQSPTWRSFLVTNLTTVGANQEATLKLRTGESLQHPGFDNGRKHVSVRLAETVETIDEYAVTSEEQVYNDVRLRENIINLRPEVYQWECGWIGMNTRRGHVCPISHWALKVGHSFGRIATIINDTFNYSEGEAKQPLEYQRYEADGFTVIDYGILIQDEDLISTVHPIRNEADFAAVATLRTTHFEFSTGAPTSRIWLEDHVIAIGPIALLNVDGLITSVRGISKYAYEISAVPYSPEIYDNDLLGIDLPSFDPRVFVPDSTPIGAAPADPINCSAKGQMVLNSEGKITRQVKAVFFAANAFNSGSRTAATMKIEVQYRLCADSSAFLPETPWRSWGIFDVHQAETIIPFKNETRSVDVRFRAVSAHDVPSNFVVVTGVKLLGETGKVAGIQAQDFLKQTASGVKKVLRITWSYPQGVSKHSISADVNNVGTGLADNRFTLDPVTADFKSFRIGQQLVTTGFLNAENNGVWTIFSAALGSGVINVTPTGVTVDELASANGNVQMETFNTDDEGTLLLRPEYFIVRWSFDGGARKTDVVLAGSGENTFFDVLDAQEGIYTFEVTAAGPDSAPGKPVSRTFQYSQTVDVDLPRPRGLKAKGSPHDDPGKFVGRDLVVRCDHTAPLDFMLRNQGQQITFNSGSINTGFIDCYEFSFIDPVTDEVLEIIKVRGSEEPQATYGYDLNFSQSVESGRENPRRDILVRVVTCDASGNESPPAVLLCHNPKAPEVKVKNFVNGIGNSLGVVLHSIDHDLTDDIRLSVNRKSPYAIRRGVEKQLADRSHYTVWSKPHNQDNAREITDAEIQMLDPLIESANRAMVFPQLEINRVYLMRMAQSDVYSLTSDEMILATHSDVVQFIDDGYVRMIQEPLIHEYGSPISDWIDLSAITIEGTGATPTISTYNEFGHWFHASAGLDHGYDLSNPIPTGCFSIYTVHHVLYKETAGGEVILDSGKNTYDSSSPSRFTSDSDTKPQLIGTHTLTNVADPDGALAAGEVATYRYKFRFTTLSSSGSLSTDLIVNANLINPGSGWKVDSSVAPSIG